MEQQELFLVLAIAAEWAVIDVAARVLFAAFALFDLFMLWRAGSGRAALRDRQRAT